MNKFRKAANKLTSSLPGLYGEEIALEAETNKLATKDIEVLVKKYTTLNDMEDNIRGILSKKEGVLPQGVVREIAETVSYTHLTLPTILRV